MPGAGNLIVEARAALLDAVAALEAPASFLAQDLLSALA